MTEIQNFAAREAQTFNANFRNPFTRKFEPLPTLVLTRVQIRLLFITQHVRAAVLELNRADFVALFEDVITLCKRQHAQVDNRFANRLAILRSGNETLFHAIPYDAQQVGYDIKHLYSALDFIRTVELESTDETPIDLVRFARLTDKILKIAV